MTSSGIGPLAKFGASTKKRSTRSPMEFRRLLRCICGVDRERGRERDVRGGDDNMEWMLCYCVLDGCVLSDKN